MAIISRQWKIRPDSIEELLLIREQALVKGAVYVVSARSFLAPCAYEHAAGDEDEEAMLTESKLFRVRTTILNITKRR